MKSITNLAAFIVLLISSSNTSSAFIPSVSAITPSTSKSKSFAKEPHTIFTTISQKLSQQQQRNLHDNYATNYETDSPDLDEIIITAKYGEDGNAMLRHELLWGHDGDFDKFYYDKHSYPWEYVVSYIIILYYRYIMCTYFGEVLDV